MTARVWARLLSAVGLLAAMVVLPGVAIAAPPSASGWAVLDGEGAQSFTEDYTVNTDGSIDAVQTIVWAFPEGAARHGIMRFVETQAGYRDNTTQYRHYELSDVRASSPSGAPADVDVSDFGSEAQIRIGDPSTTVTGTQTYVLRYHLAKVVNDVGNGTAELYYNTISSNDFPYARATVHVKGPVASTKVLCFVGALGATTQCPATPGATATFTTSLAAGQGMTVAASFPRSAFGDLTPDLRQYDTGGYSGDRGSSTGLQPLDATTARRLGYTLLALAIFLPALAAALMGLRVWTHGRDEVYQGLTPELSPGLGQPAAITRQARHGTVAVRFTPPDGVQPGMVGTVLDEVVDPEDVTATVLDLAVRGYLRLEADDSVRQGEDWLISPLEPPAGARPLAPYEQVLLDKIVGGGAIHLSSLKRNFSLTMSQVRRMMYDESVQRGWFRKSPQAVRTPWRAAGGALAVLGLVLVVAGIVLSPLFAGSRVPLPVSILGLGLLLCGVIVALAGKRMPARTAAGSAVLAQSLGFRQYLVTAEARQIRFEEAQDLFSRFLPYAIVFGVAQKWAKVFEEVAASAQAQGVTIAPPLWYVGPWMAGGWGPGSFGHLAEASDSFSTYAAGTFVATPGSSGGSAWDSGGGFGGFGGGGFGGGFAGGGGGGGGGGSW